MGLQNKQENCQAEKAMTVTADDVVDEMRSLVVANMGDRAPGETIQRCLETAARNLGISYARAWSYWYRRVRKVPAEELENARIRNLENERRHIARLRQEIAERENRIAQMQVAARKDSTDVGARSRRIAGRED